MQRLVCFILIILPLGLLAQLNLVPMPAEVKMGKGSFIFSKQTTISLGHNPLALEKLATYLKTEIKNKFGYDLQIVRTENKINVKSNIELSFTPFHLSPENIYEVIIKEKQLTVIAYKDEAIFQGIQTLLQLLEQQSYSQKQRAKNLINLQQLTITDFPRFQYRGMHLDVARHFFPISYIKKYIDYLAAYKFNTFHWHLTDDQGWRIEIKKYPNLTKVGAYRDGTIIGRYPGKGNDNIRYGGYYTQEEIKEVIKYATERYITVIPEIEMPGHGVAALASYPYLGCTKGPYKTFETWGVTDDVFCAGNDSTFTFLQNVLDEVIALFPSKYIHIGGDECPKERWKKCAMCQKRMVDNNLKDEHELQSYFINRIEKFVNNKGRNIIGWDEILEGGLAPNATVMSWRGEEGGIEAAKQNHNVIMTPGGWCYLDHTQTKNEDSVTIGGYTPLEKVYSYEPIPASFSEEQAKHILGAQGNMWTEYMAYPSKIEYMLFPRMMALSEVLWTPKEKRNWNDFERRLPYLFDKLKKQKINFSKAYYDLKATVIPTENNDGVLWKLETKNTSDKIQYLTGVEDDRVNSYTSPIAPFRLSGIECSAWVQNEKGVTVGNILKQKFYFNKATGKKITLKNDPSKNYPGDGAFSLVNGVQNEKGLAKGSEFLGFLGTNCEGSIDFGKQETVKKIKFHVLKQTGSWIYPPQFISITYGNDIIGFKKVAVSTPTEDINGNLVFEIMLHEPVVCSSFNFIVENFGVIPSGNPGAGNKAWLFVDEIEVE